jgi:hypothetical protein
MRAPESHHKTDFTGQAKTEDASQVPGAASGAKTLAMFPGSTKPKRAIGRAATSSTALMPRLQLPTRSGANFQNHSEKEEKDAEQQVSNA